MSQDKMLQVLQEIRDNQKAALEIQKQAYERSEKMHKEIKENQRTALEAQKGAIERSKISQLVSMLLVFVVLAYMLYSVWRLQ